MPVQVSDCELVERVGDSKPSWGFGGEFVVAAAEVLNEGESGDDHLSGAVGSQPSHESKPVFEAAVTGVS